MHSNRGCVDLVLKYYGKIWIVGIKVAYEGENPEQKAKEVLNQIFDMNYSGKYKEVTSLGVAIDNEKREITN
jgi:hypothetical protein